MTKSNNATGSIRTRTFNDRLEYRLLVALSFVLCLIFVTAKRLFLALTSLFARAAGRTQAHKESIFNEALANLKTSHK